ncbi:MAG TPA: M48 family metalloprotease [Gammaproteobacteria bacterium]|jgi:Zn-dependent protease with chaperone function
MDFFDRQDASRRATRHLVLMFALAFVAVGLATGILILLVIGVSGEGQPAAFVISEPDVLASIATIVVAVMVLASLFRVASLAQGGGHVARMLGGTQVRGDDSDPNHRKLVNVVEEMAIASGLPVPEIYVLEQERGINAFAAGLTPGDAAVAVTRGSLEQLSRSELQGVVAHEFSHILNGDMRLNLRLMGFSFGILVLALAGRSVLRASGRGMHIRVGRRGKGAGGVLMIGLGLLIIGSIGVLLSRLIKAAVSRQREVLADASAVQFTREPMALAGALKKIGGFTPFIEHAETEEVSHMLFGRAGKSFVGLFATHPPLDERIKALDPSFEPGDYIVPGSASMDAGEPPAAGISRLADAPANLGLETAGTIEPDKGVALRAAIPSDLADAAHSSQSAWLLVLALGLERGGGTEAERQLVQNQVGSERAQRCFELRDQIEALDPELRLPLFELAVPALKSRPPEEIEFLFALLAKLAEADGRVSLFEYLLQRILRAYCYPPETLWASPASRAQAMRNLILEFAIHGSESPESVKAAFAAGLEALDSAAAPVADEDLARSGRGTEFGRLDHALTVLADAPARERRRALTALAVTMRHDARVSIREAELFRAAAAVLGCPVPPPARIG